MSIVMKQVIFNLSAANNGATGNAESLVRLGHKGGLALLVLNTTQEIQVLKAQLYILVTLDQLDLLVKPVIFFKR